MALTRRAKTLLLKSLISKRRKRRNLLIKGMAIILLQRLMTLRSFLLAATYLFGELTTSRARVRSCRRLPRNTGWWEKLWFTYDDKRFKQTLRVSRSTFEFILTRIRPQLERQTLTEEPISPELRLAICLYRLGRGDYLYSIGEMVGLARSTVTRIVNEVTQVIVFCLWEQFVSNNMPKTEDEFQSKISDMEELWQFPCSWAAVDGCHIPIKCPPGGQSSRKEYHNFKNFYSIVLMALVDAKYRFIWGSCGFPGNSHDSIILQSTSLWKKIKDGKMIPEICQQIDAVKIPPLILGDSAFLFESFLMKPYTNAVLTKEQRYFNYRLSRARMVIEGAFGQLKGRWRFLLRKSEGNVYEIKVATLACLVLHNICLDCGDTLPSKLDVSIDPQSSQRRDRATIRDLLLMSTSRKIFDARDNKAVQIRKTLESKLAKELAETSKK
ncbi:uncharacterized protein LOC135693062 [Rhopilema esculentum]|uniref:uncharacterized protein LOC135693062 n=1 Tax=Rhopilema esculentum TaxID=499914 RepID=UPI0031E1A14C